LRVDLGGNEWADLRDLDQLRRADRVAVNEKIVIQGDRESGLVIKASMDNDMAAALLERIVENWSLALPLPSQDPNVLDKLTLAQDDALSKAIEPYIAAIRGREAPVKDNEVPTNASDS
jgi:hypothetical protein